MGVTADGGHHVRDPAAFRALEGLHAGAIR